MARARRWSGLAAVACAAACASAAANGATDAVSIDELWLPANARPGMFVSWQCSGGEVAGKELACVAGPDGKPIVEWRQTATDGTCTVTAARFASDGRIDAAWRGKRGAVGERLELAPSTVDEALGKAQELQRQHGLAPRSDTTLTIDVLDGLAGPLRCRKQVIATSLLFVESTLSTWHAVDPLPLSQLVRFEVRSPGWNETKQLVAYGWSGAVPALVIPADSR